MVEFGLVGKGISHSFSAEFFNNKFRRQDIDAKYINFDLNDISDLRALIASRSALKGFNVTSPYKREVIPILDSLSPTAAELKAVNVVRIIRKHSELSSDKSCRKDFVLEGHNTDSAGFGLTLPPLLKDMKSSSDWPLVAALILGTGGAASAVGLALSKAEIPYKFISRSPTGKNAAEPIFSYSDLPKLIDSHRLIINATPVGMYPDEDVAPDIPYHLLSSHHICYDLIYNPAETLFLKNSKSQGAKTVNGKEMLINQAELSWKIWNSDPASSLSQKVSL